MRLRPETSISLREGRVMEAIEKRLAALTLNHRRALAISIAVVAPFGLQPAGWTGGSAFLAMNPDRYK